MPNQKPASQPVKPPTGRDADRAAEAARQSVTREALAVVHRDVLPSLGAHPDGTVLVLPRKGVILADVPPTGARMPEAQAAEWARNGLVTIAHEEAGG